MYVRVVNRTTDFLLRCILPYLRALLTKNEAGATTAVQVVSDHRLPESVSRVPDLGPKFSVEARMKKVDLPLVRQVSNLAPGKEKDRLAAYLNQDGRAASGARLPARSGVGTAAKNDFELIMQLSAIVNGLLRQVSIDSGLVYPQNHIMEEELEVAAREELEETPELRKASVEKFRNLLQEETDLRLPPDYVLLMFLRARKYRMDNALKSLKNFFRTRTNLPEYFDNYVPSALDYQTITREHKLLILSKDRDSQGRTAGLIRLGAWNGSICSFNEFIKSVLMGVECALLEDETQIRGIVGVTDLAGLGVHHITHMTPRFLRLMIALAQDTYPLRPKAFYIVNTPAVFEGIFNLLVKPFLSKKLKRRVHLLKGDLSELCGVIPSDLIPKELGGTFEEFDYDRFERYMREKESHFEIMRQCGYAANCSTN
ncbi:hypothetical protein MTO96_032222 [Rhipicephalus appendiculatus]